MARSSAFDGSPIPFSIPAQRYAAANISVASPAPAEDDLLRRYTTPIERKPGNGKGKGKGQSQTDKRSKRRLTYSKDPNLQALML